MYLIIIFPLPYTSQVFFTSLPTQLGISSLLKIKQAKQYSNTMQT